MTVTWPRGWSSSRCKGHVHRAVKENQSPEGQRRVPICRHWWVTKPENGVRRLSWQETKAVAAAWGVDSGAKGWVGASVQGAWQQWLRWGEHLWEGWQWGWFHGELVTLWGTERISKCNENKERQVSYCRK